MKRFWLSWGWIVLLLFACKGNKESDADGTLPAIGATDEDPTYSNFRAEPFQRTFKGKLNGQYPITLQLSSSDGAALQGSYSYDGKMGGSYAVSGSVAPSGLFSLLEKDAKGSLRSAFNGYFFDRHWMEGEWSAAEGEEPIPFKFGDGFAPFAGAGRDTVPGFKGIEVLRRAVRGDSCACWVRVPAPQLLGVASQESQDAANRSLRFAAYRLADELLGASDQRGADKALSFKATYLAASFFSGVLQDAEGNTAAAFVVDLQSGEVLPAEQLIRDQQALLAHLGRQSPPITSLDQGLLWLSDAGIHLSDGHSEQVIAWSHPQLQSWFRNLPPSV